MPQISGHIFISYSRRDDALMRRVAFSLRDQNFKVWVDNEKLIPGTMAWEESIENAIRNAFAVVAILSPEARDSEWVRREIAYADQYHKRIFPLLSRGDENSAVPIRLITRQYIDLRGDENAGLSALGAALTFYVEEKQTLEMKRPEVKPEADPIPPSLRPTPIPARQAPSAKKWIVPTGISVGLLVLALGALWIGNRIFSSLPSPAQSDSTLPASTVTTPTAMMNHQPVQASVPSTLMVSAPDKSLEYLDDVQVLYVDPFDDPLGSGWSIDSGNIETGALQIIGNEDWRGASRDKVFGEGEGLVVEFTYSKDSLFETIWEYGAYDTDAYSRFGIYVRNDRIESNKYVGRNDFGGADLPGDFALKPDTTYSLLMAILPNGEFLAVVGDPSDPSATVYFREKMDETWANLTWSFWIQANRGTILFDNY